MSQGLPRELLKWLQGLDLSYSIKNVRRDFSNGFLIAEIFSRYYVSDIQMGGYDNGFSLQRKLDNWDQLNKFFVKRGIQIDKALIHDVVHCKSQEGPVELVSAVYTALTGRELKKRPEDPSEGAADPAFMRNTNASLLHQQTRESELKTSLVDRDQQKAVHSEVIEAHEADLRADRAADPGRYATMSGYGGSITASQKLLRGPPKPIAQAMETAAVRFQEVKVKPVDQNIAQLRASREASSLAQLSGAGGSGVGGAGPPLPSVVGVLTDALLGEAELVQALGGGAHLGADPDAFRSFLKRLGDVPADAAARLFVSLCADGETLAKSAVGSPKQAWLLFHLLTTALSAAPPPVFDAVAALLAQVGAHAVAADAVAAESLMRDFGLPPLLVLCKAMPTRLRPLLALVYAFAPDTTAAHIGVIKGLQEALDEPQARTRRAPPAPPLPRLPPPPPLSPPPLVSPVRPSSRCSRYSSPSRPPSTTTSSTSTSTTPSSGSGCRRRASAPPPRRCCPPSPPTTRRRSSASSPASPPSPPTDGGKCRRRPRVCASRSSPSPPPSTPPPPPSSPVSSAAPSRRATRRWRRSRSPSRRPSSPPRPTSSSLPSVRCSCCRRRSGRRCCCRRPTRRRCR